jgi:hypothetical protein
MKFASALALFAAAALPSVLAENITVTVGQGGNTFTVCIIAFPFALFSLPCL